MSDAPEPRPPKALALTLKYKDADEQRLRRLGQALVPQWDELPDALQDVLIDQAVLVSDRHADAVVDAGKVETFIRGVKSVAVG